MTEDTLRKYGWKPIASDAHANQLLRRELKHHAKWQQRGSDRQCDYRTLLAIKRGNWYRFLGNPRNAQCSILISRQHEKREQHWSGRFIAN